MRVLVQVLVLICALWGSALSAEGRMIKVTGLGEIAAVPDMAVMQVGVSVESTRAEDAVRQISERVKSVLAQIEALGIAARDVQSSQMTLNPVWENNQLPGTPRRLRGYFARSEVTVRVRNLPVLGKLLDVAVRDGANEFGGLRFTMADPAPAEAAARAAAVRDAAAKAAQIAEAAGVSLGPVQTITEYSRSDVRTLSSSAGFSARDVPVAPGEITVNVQISAEYAIK